MAINREFDDAVDLQLDLFRAAAGVTSDVLSILRRLERDLVARLAGERLTEWSRARINRQISEVRTLIREVYGEVAAVALEGTSGIGAVTATATAATLRVASGDTVTMLSREFLETLAGNAIVQGAVQADWWRRQGDDAAFRFAQEVRQGVAAQEATQTIVRRVRDALAVTRANAAALVQTSVATVANDARQAMFDQNLDIIKRFRAVATLDTRTCTRCAPLDGLEWQTDGTPIGHNQPLPRYPLHYNCRCLLIPQVFDTPPGGQRAATGGPVSASLTFEGWLERQTPAKVEEMLGKGRAELYLAGKITLADLTNGTGRPLTLAQLRARYE